MIPNRQKEIDALVARYLADPKSESNGHRTTPQLEDAQIVALCRKAKNAAKFADLYDDGDTHTYHNGDDSTADLSLMAMLAFYTQDRDQLERIFSASTLGQRAKWGRADYRERTINAALDRLADTYAPAGPKMGKNGTKPPRDDADEPQSRFVRYPLSGAIENGVEPVAELVEGVLYEGAVHSIFSGGGQGKTYLALWLIKQATIADRRVILFDQENGARIVSERLRSLGVTSEQAELIHYFPFPSAPLDPETTVEFERLLDDVEPALVVFDSWINFLAAAGLDENSSVDIATWADAYSQQARKRGIAVLLLDHVPKADATTARGSGRKLDYVDVMWELSKSQDFDREKMGRIDLRLKKDREGWLPRGASFVVGTSEGGKFVFGRAAFDGTMVSEGDTLLKSDLTTLDALTSFGAAGATNQEWETETKKRNVGRTTYYKARKNLLEAGKAAEIEGERYVSTSVQLCPTGQVEQQPSDAVQSSPTTLGVGLVDSPGHKSCSNEKNPVIHYHGPPAVAGSEAEELTLAMALRLLLEKRPELKGASSAALRDALKDEYGRVWRVDQIESATT